MVAALWSPAALAKGRSNFDAFLQQQGRTQVPTDARAQAEQRGLRIQHTEPRFGVPTFVRAEAPQPAAGVTMRVLTPDGAAREHLRGSASLYRVSGTDVDAAELKSVHSTGRGPVVVKYGQSIEGVEVFRSETSVVMNPGLELVAISGYLLPSDMPHRGTFRMGATDVAARAFSDVTGEALGAGGFVADGVQPGGYISLKLGSNASASSAHELESARAKKVYYPIGDTLEPAYYVEVSAGKRGSADSESVAYVVSAADGRVLMRNSLTADDAFTYRVFAESGSASESALFPYEGPQGFGGTPHPTGTPDGYQAPFVAPNLLTLQNYPFSRNDPWLSVGATQTTGNNVDAYADVVAPDGFTPNKDVRAFTTAPGVFDYTYDVTRAPGSSGNQRMASVTNLFYLNNFLHDWFYDA
ncbi:MAG: M36 family metallopeptidase, partial [Myxococcaceae bacterium]|nr:M36 family metallopeptidase [Myxococcaceae bacterium]